jgi:hypothetical protein
VEALPYVRRDARVSAVSETPADQAETAGDDMSMRRALRMFERHRATAGALRVEAADLDRFDEEAAAFTAAVLREMAELEEERADIACREVAARSMFEPIVVRRVLWA